MTKERSSRTNWREKTLDGSAKWLRVEWGTDSLTPDRDMW